jgi:hypothetical protein
VELFAADGPTVTVRIKFGAAGVTVGLGSGRRAESNAAHWTMTHSVTEADSD